MSEGCVSKHRLKHKILKNDEVKIIAGSDKGKIAKVLSVEKRNGRVLLVVEGCKMVTKHVKPNANSVGSIVKKESVIDISNVAFYDKRLGKATKIGYKIADDGVKRRFSKLSGDFC